MVGRVRAPPRDARTRCQDAPPGGIERGLTLPCAHAQTRPGRPLRARCRPLGSRLQRRTASLVRPDGRLYDRRPRPRRLSRSRGPGADEITRASRPGRSIRGATARSRISAALARLGIKEVRFAGGTWSFGAERAAVLAVFRTHGLTAEYLAAFYNESARAAGRTKILGASEPMIAGRQGHRLDTMTGERLQTVVVWPSAEADVINVVITNDLPDAADPGRHRCIRGCLMLKFVMRHGLVRHDRRPCGPVDVGWDVAVLANKARRIPVVDRTLRKGRGRGCSRCWNGRAQPALDGASEPPWPARAEACAPRRMAPARHRSGRLIAQSRIVLRTPC